MEYIITLRQYLGFLSVVIGAFALAVFSVQLLQILSQFMHGRQSSIGKNWTSFRTHTHTKFSTHTQMKKIPSGNTQQSSLQKTLVSVQV